MAPPATDPSATTLATGDNGPERQDNSKTVGDKLRPEEAEREHSWRAAGSCGRSVRSVRHCRPKRPTTMGRKMSESVGARPVGERRLQCQQQQQHLQQDQVQARAQHNDDDDDDDDEQRKLLFRSESSKASGANKNGSESEAQATSAERIGESSMSLVVSGGANSCDNCSEQQQNHHANCPRDQNTGHICELERCEFDCCARLCLAAPEVGPAQLCLVADGANKLTFSEQRIETILGRVGGELRERKRKLTREFSSPEVGPSNENNRIKCHERAIEAPAKGKVATKLSPLHIKLSYKLNYSYCNRRKANIVHPFDIMWPNLCWRQLVLIALLLVCLTSLLANFGLLGRAPSCVGTTSSLLGSACQSSPSFSVAAAAAASEVSLVVPSTSRATTTHFINSYHHNSNTNNQLRNSSGQTTEATLDQTTSGSSSAPSAAAAAAATTTTQKPPLPTQQLLGSSAGPTSPANPIAASSNEHIVIATHQPPKTSARAEPNKKPLRHSSANANQVKQLALPGTKLNINNFAYNDNTSAVASAPINNEHQQPKAKWSIVAKPIKSIRLPPAPIQASASSFDYDLLSASSGNNASSDDATTNIERQHNRPEPPRDSRPAQPVELGKQAAPQALAPIVVGRKPQNYYPQQQGDASGQLQESKVSASANQQPSASNRPAIKVAVSVAAAAEAKSQRQSSPTLGAATQLGGWTVISANQSSVRGANRDDNDDDNDAALRASSSSISTASSDQEPSVANSSSPIGPDATIGLKPRLALAQWHRRASHLTGHSSLAPIERQSSALAAATPVLGPNVLEGVVRDALFELVSGAGGGGAQPLVAGPVRPFPLALAAATQPLPLVSFAASPVISGAYYQAPRAARLQAPAKDAAASSAAASASAPSVALPPISHLLAPRNPFRLFASTSTPIGSRLRPFASDDSTSKRPAGNRYTRWFLNPFGGGSGGAAASSASSSNNKQPPAASAATSASAAHELLPAATPFQGAANWAALDELGPQLALSSLASTSTAPSLYAHSHSAGQLEHLIKAASRANGLKSAPILAAIVSSPTGAFPGFYIPALDSDAESQPSDGSSLAASSSNNVLAPLAAAAAAAAATRPLVSSKIPGTDYVLHPEEVRAMISIGELAWRRQQATLAGASQAASAQQASESSDRGWRVSSMGPQQAQAGNYMQENHAANARDYAFVMPNEQQHQAAPAGDFGKLTIRQAPNSANRNHYPGANGSAHELESQLTRHFAQNELHSFPAIIRVNDQDYVHWPLISVAAQHNNNNNNGHNNGQQHKYASQSRYNEHRLATAATNEQSSNNENRNSANSYESNDINSPVRLATQLTPHEIRQVEDSVLETLIMAKTLQQQRKLAESLALANQQAPIILRPPMINEPNLHNRANWMTTPNWRLAPPLAAPTSGGQQAYGFRAGFFGRRRRRNSSQQQQHQQQANNAKRLPESLLASASSLWGALPLAPANKSQDDLSRAMGVESALLLPLAPLAHYANNGETQWRFGRPASDSPQAQVVMADQETNKPMRSPIESQLGDSTAPRVSVLAPTNHLSHGVFGARVALAPSLKVNATRSPQLAPPLAQPPKASGSQPQQVIFVPAPRQILVPPLDLVQVSRASNQLVQPDRPPTTRRPPHRVNVDWPAMLSDADYFPAAGSEPMQPEAALKLPIAAPPAQVDGAKAEATNRNFITSQMKLQFTQDYQAREGVPIYNNNVLVAGALDRMRARGSASVRPASREAGAWRE